MQLAENHADVFAITADAPALNASLQDVNEQLDDVIGPSVDQLTTNLELSDERLTECEDNIENVVRTQNASHLALTSQLQFAC